MKKNGVSLIVLVITIVVLIIITGAIVLNITMSNPIDKANQAKLKQDLASIYEVLHSNNNSTEDDEAADLVSQGVIDEQGTPTSTMAGVYKDKIKVIGDSILFITSDVNEQKAAYDAGYQLELVNNFEYTGYVQTYTIPITGTYKFKVWGAQGASTSNDNSGGKGGYSEGNISLSKGTTIRVYVGGAGQSTVGGWNGGGNGYGTGSGGGGATDIRIGSTSYGSRYIVAGGGGGSYSSSFTGGAGGGTSGLDCSPAAGFAATQSTGNIQGVGLSASWSGASGGGGGYYGGKAAINGTYGTSGGGGGSGFLSGSLSSASTKAGNVLFNAPTQGAETGHSGNGYAQIIYTPTKVLLVNGEIPNLREFSFIGATPQPFTAPVTGTYNLEVWGAEGGGSRLSGNSASGYGGKGGYSAGSITLSQGSLVYIYVGGYGASSMNGLAAGGWNGGGTGYASNSGEPGNGGGGATDIRLLGTAYSNRIIIAGGGGGGGEDTGDTYGHGGGTTGSGSTSYNATQTSGYALGVGSSTNYGDGRWRRWRILRRTIWLK